MSQAKRSALTSPVSMLRTVVPLALGALLLLSGASVLAAPPVVTVTVSPGAPQAGEPVTFTATASDPDAGGTIALIEWDFNGDGILDAQGASATNTFATGGPKRVATRVTDAAVEQTVVQTNVAVNGAPTVAGIDISPRAPRSGQLVRFSRRASDPDGHALSTAWDTDSDGQFDDAPGRTYRRGGEYPVSVRVSDGRGGQATRLRVVEVATATGDPPPVNTRPTALISLTPSSPTVGQLVTFSGAGSSDFDGDSLSYAWETGGATSSTTAVASPFRPSSPGRSSCASRIRAGCRMSTRSCP